VAVVAVEQTMALAQVELLALAEAVLVEVLPLVLVRLAQPIRVVAVEVLVRPLMVMLAVAVLSSFEPSHPRHEPRYQ
jgi:hypothetical protein